MYDKAVFAGTFDPFTLGHYEIAARAAKRFDEVVVAVADVTGKECAFSLAERVKIATLSLQGLKNVKVTSFSGFLVDFMNENGVRTFVRGLRNSVDFEYERNLYNVYKSQCDEIEGCYFMASNECLHISSSLVREVLAIGGDVSKYVRSEALGDVESAKKR